MAFDRINMTDYTQLLLESSSPELRPPDKSSKARSLGRSTATNLESATVTGTQEDGYSACFSEKRISTASQASSWAIHTAEATLGVTAGSGGVG